MTVRKRSSADVLSAPLNPNQEHGSFHIPTIDTRSIELLTKKEHMQNIYDIFVDQIWCLLTSADISHVANRCIHLLYHIYLSKLKFFQVAPNRTSNQPLDGLSLQPEHDEMLEAANPYLNSDDDMNNAMDDAFGPRSDEEDLQGIGSINPVQLQSIWNQNRDGNEHQDLDDDLPDEEDVPDPSSGTVSAQESLPRMHLPKLQIAQDMIEYIKNAMLEDDIHDEEKLHDIHNPATYVPVLGQLMELSL